jgi:hypothetical protein
MMRGISHIEFGFIETTNNTHLEVEEIVKSFSRSKAPKYQPVDKLKLQPTQQLTFNATIRTITKLNLNQKKYLLCFSR